MGNVVIVLVEPQQSGNVGGAARAMKNMGLDRLILVAPPCFDPEKARWMAPGCDDILAQMRIVGTMDAALEGVHRVVATTARHRRYVQQVLDPRELGEQIAIEPDGRTTAVLFGREDFGLTAEMVERCQAIVRIRTPEHASLNLAQAVLLVSHSIFEARRASGASAAPGRTLGGRRGIKPTSEVERTDRAADVSEVEGAVSSLVGLLRGVGYTRRTDPDKVAMTVRAALQRAGVSRREISALRGMITTVARALHPTPVPPSPE